MKWGVRRYQNKDGSLTAAGRKKYGSNQSNKKSEDSDNKSHLTDKQKKILKIGAVAVTTAAVAYGGYKLVKSGKLDPLIDKGKDYLSKSGLMSKRIPIDKNTGLQLQKEKLSIADNLKKINPKYSLLDSSSYTNCGNCSIAFEARMRGYDVTALGNKSGMRLSQFGEFFNGLSSNSFHKVDPIIPEGVSSAAKSKLVSDSIKNTITKSYDGNARGCIFYTHEYGSHFFNWVKSGNDVKFYDGQNPKVDFDKLFSIYKRHTGSNSVYETTVVRLDDLEINSNNIKSIIKNVADKKSFNSSDFDTFVSKGENFVMRYK